MASPIISINPKIMSDEIQRLKNWSTVADENIRERVDWITSGIIGAKNFNSYPYNETSHTDNGIVWTDNGDGTIKANDKATGNSDFFCHSRVQTSVNTLRLPNGKYILSGCPSGGGNTTFFVRVQATLNGVATTIAQDTGSGSDEFTVNGDDNNTDFAVVTVDCRIVNGYTADNLLFKPMIRRAEDSDDTWEPYSMTNKQLTDLISNIKCSKTTAGTYKLEATVAADGSVSYEWVEVV